MRYPEFAVCRFQHFGTCHSYCTGEIYTTCIEKAANEDYGLRINSPYRFSLGYGVEMVDLNTYITRRVRSVESGDCNILSLCQCSSVLFHTDIQIGFASLARASSPVWKFVSSPLRANSKSGANGLVSNADTKIPFGVTVGSAMMS